MMKNTPRLLAHLLTYAVAQMLASAAVAQAEPAQTPPTEIAEVIVTGVRESLNKAVELKRDDVQFVDAVVADDIGKLPDTNVAESLARVSGVQIDRGIGEGTDISIRGQRQNVILYNGRQIFDATGRGGHGLDQLNTSTYGLLALVPSELISTLAVTKLSGAEQIEGGLGGVVNIISRKPLDQPGMHFAGSASTTYDALPGKTGYEAFGLASDTFADDTVGLLVSAAAGRRNLAEHGLNTFSGWGVIADNAAPLFDGNGNPVSNDPNGDGRSGILDLDARLQQITERRDRIGLTATAQWKPTSAFELTWDTFYSNLDSDRDRHWIGYFAGYGTHTNVVFSPNEALLAGIVTRPVNTNVEYAHTKADILSTALSSEWHPADSWAIKSGVDYSDSTSSYAQRFFRLQTANAVPITYDLRVGDFGSFTFPTDLTDPAQLDLTIFYDNLFTAKTKNKSVNLDTAWSSGSSWIKSIEAGARYNEIDTDEFERLRTVTGAIPATLLSNVLTTFSNSNFLKGSLPGLPRSYLSADKGAFTGCNAFAGLLDADQQAACAVTSTPLGSFGIKESFAALYAKATFSSRMHDVAISGNFGVRFLRRNLTSAGSLISNSAIVPNVFERTDNEILPSAVAKIDASTNVVVRLGAARVVAFPNTTDLNNGLQDYGDGTGVGGSPDLNPFRATQYDAALEWYFAPKSVVSLGAFVKNVDTFIIQSARQEQVPGDSGLVTIVRQINGSGAKVHGLEVLYQQPFSFLPVPFDGLGVASTYSLIDSNSPVIDRNGNNLPLPGLSKNNVNLVMYYEKGPASIRLAYNWRDKYLQGIGPSNTGVFYAPYKDFAATAKWDINKRLAVTLEGVNLLDSQLRTYNAFPEALRTNVLYGRVYKLTLSGRY